MTDKKAVTTGGLPPLVKTGIIIIVVLVVLGIVSSFLSGFIFKKAGTAIINKTIEGKTGIKTNVEDIEKGKMTLTDPKTGAKIEVNTGKIPDNFPKNFPVYPGSKIAGTVSGNKEGTDGGIWLTFSSGDSLAKISQYYKDNFKAKGWNAKAILEANENVTYSVSDGKMEGTLTVTRATDTNESTIIIML